MPALGAAPGMGQQATVHKAWCPREEVGSEAFVEAPQLCAEAFVGVNCMLEHVYICVCDCVNVYVCEQTC